MKTPVFKYSKVWYGISAVLTIPLLIDICTACHLFPLWLAWILFFLICGISLVRLWFGFKQHLYKFCWGLIGQLALGAGVLIFFQLSYTRIIETPVSNPVTPAVVDIRNPLEGIDSVHKDAAKQKDSLNQSEKTLHKHHDKNDMNEDGKEKK